MILTFKFRIKSRSAAPKLRALAIGANQVWNFAVATQRESLRRWRGGANARRVSHFDLTTLTAGCAADLGIHSDTVGEVCRIAASAQRQHGKPPRFRSSFGSRRALGWVPFRGRAVQVVGATATYRGQRFHFWKSRELPSAIRGGAFIEDARGRWYVIFYCDVLEGVSAGEGRVGIDLGLKALATLSTGETIPALQHYRQYEAALATAQRAHNKSRARAIHAKIANARHHHLHEQSTRIVRENAFIAVGDVSPTKLAKTKFAKSVFDAGWSTLRTQLRYKARRHGATFIEVDERYTSQTCSDCGVIGGPKGREGLRVRQWGCSSCGAVHDRDQNAAQNILRAGLERQPPSGETASARALKTTGGKQALLIAILRAKGV